jgi:hypothetical protein
MTSQRPEFTVHDAVNSQTEVVPHTAPPVQSPSDEHETGVGTDVVGTDVGDVGPDVGIEVGAGLGFGSHAVGALQTCDILGLLVADADVLAVL